MRCRQAPAKLVEDVSIENEILLLAAMLLNERREDPDYIMVYYCLPWQYSVRMVAFPS